MTAISPERCIGGRDLTEPRLSPDGTMLGYAVTSAGDTSLVALLRARIPFQHDHNQQQHRRDPSCTDSSTTTSRHCSSASTRIVSGAKPDALACTANTSDCAFIGVHRELRQQTQQDSRE